MSIKLEYWTRDKKTGYDLSNSVNNVKWTTDLNYSAGELAFDLYFDESPKKPALGGIIKFWYNSKKIFYGYVFDVKVSADRTVSVTAYDKLYYLKSQDSIVWPTMTLGSRFNEVCKRAGVTHKIVNKPTHKVKAEICEGKTYFDMIKSAVNKTKSGAGSYYFVTANWSTVELRKAPYKKLTLILGDKSGMTSGSLQESITDAYNVVKVYTKHTKGKKTSTAKSGYSTTSYQKSSNNARTCWNFFKSKGLSGIAIAGICGNIAQESQYSPTATSGNNDIGIIQWTGSAKTALISWCNSHGLKYTSLSAQLDYLWNASSSARTSHGIKNNAALMRGLRNAKSIEAAVDIFEQQVEGAGIPAMGNRYRYAHQIYNEMNGSSVKGSKTSSKSSTTTTETPKNTSFTFTTAKGSTIARWGLLQKVVQKKDKANSAQAKAQAKAELKSSNQITKTLTVDCIGNVDFVAGNSVNLKIGYLSQNKSNVPITKAVHTWSSSSYTCSLTLKAGKKWLESGF
ncbi:phage tail tip lysozyme [Lactobacillus delbrueckii]|uniref:phage tail tip lysozyme n=1 Tax=Lactobacillus delbrueckii TaxID=1584 RepID=UPI0025B13307|nr:phage tail tip lysozyme [Lactobacillus delbrueckii]